MTSSHEQYTQCIRGELELFSLPPLQISVEGQWVDYHPASTITSSAPIEFVVTRTGDEYIYVNKTLFEVKTVIKRTNGDVAPRTAHMALVNTTLHYLFSRLDVTLNDVPKSSSTTTNPYRAYIESHLNYGNAAKESRLSAGYIYYPHNVIQNVPQGDILSPTLFNIYTADIPLPRAPVQVMAYADEITITSTHKHECSEDIHTTITNIKVLPGQNKTI